MHRIAYIIILLLKALAILTNAENDYDEPSLPSPIYQEINENNIMAPQQEMQIEMMKNYSYATVRSTIILRECPAYVQQSDVTV